MRIGTLLEILDQENMLFAELVIYGDYSGRIQFSNGEYLVHWTSEKKMNKRLNKFYNKLIKKRSVNKISQMEIMKKVTQFDKVDLFLIVFFFLIFLWVKWSAQDQFLQTLGQ